MNAGSHRESPVQTRIAALDVLRGVAVGGILLANVMVFFGLTFAGPEQTVSLVAAPIDRWVQALERTLVEGKFYSVFSLLFGVGFGLQLGRGGAAAVDRFRRRLKFLLAIGAVHAVLIWAGDILMLYALLGFTMPWFARRTDRSLLHWTLGLLATPVVVYLVAYLVWQLAGSGTTPGAASATDIPEEVRAIFARMGRGGPIDAFIGNLVLLVGRWLDLFATMRFPKVLGMFVFGLWLVRRGIALDPAAHRRLLTRWCLLGWAVGVPANAAGWWAFSQGPYLPPSAGGLLGVVLHGIGIPLLALGYAATVALAVANGNRLVALFAPVGRMALTNYLTHSIVCVVLSYGFGAGLWWRVTPSGAWLIALAVIAVQIPLCRWWLGRHHYGPAEWAWRRLTYARPLPMRRPSWNT